MPDDAKKYDDLVIKIVADTLKIPSASPEDKFAELQVNSILLLRMISTIEEEFDISIDIVDVLQAETAGDLASVVRSYAPRTKREEAGDD